MNLNIQSMEIDTALLAKERKLSLYDIVLYVQKVLINQKDVQLGDESFKPTFLMLVCIINKIAPHLKGLLLNVSILLSYYTLIICY